MAIINNIFAKKLFIFSLCLPLLFLSLTSPAHGAFKVIAINPALRSGLVGHWTLDANKIDFTAGSVTDSSIEGNTGTIQGSIPASTGQVPGKLNTAVKFNGSTEFIGLGDDTSLQLTIGTISAWVKTSAGGSDYRAVVVKQNAYGMFLKNNVFMIYDWGGGGDRSSGVNLGDNVWHHIACSFRSGVSSGTLCYVDGELQMTTTMTVAGPSSEVRIASAGNGAVNQPISASIDDVRLYNKVLSAPEIANLYRQFTTGKITISSSASPGPLAYGLVGHWTFDGSKLNQNVTDSSGQGNNGKLSGISATSSAVTEGKIGQGLKFDGVNDYIDLGDVAPLQFERTDSFSISTWVKTSQSGFHRIFHKAKNSDPYTGYWFGQYSDNTLYFELYDAGPVTAVIGRRTTTTINDGKWHHVVSTYSGTSLDSGVKLYIDGVASDTTNNSNGGGI